LEAKAVGGCVGWRITTANDIPVCSEGKIVLAVFFTNQLYRHYRLVLSGIFHCSV